MEISPTTVFRKTERGAEELKTRQHGLTPRLRQLLILIDGRRDITEIARMMPQPELAAQLARLETDGFAARADAQSDAASPAGGAAGPATAFPHTATLTATAAPSASTNRPLAIGAFADAPAPRAFSTAASASAVTESPRTATANCATTASSAAGTPADPGALQAAAPVGDPDPTGAKVAARPAAPAEDLRSLRLRLTHALLDTVGPNGDELAIRLERSRTVDELRALVPALLSVVEAVSGRRGVDLFLKRCGGI